MKDYAGAEAAYEEALKERPDSGFGLYGLALRPRAFRRLGGRAPRLPAFLKAWPAADATLPEVVHARDALGKTVVAAR